MKKSRCIIRWMWVGIMLNAGIVGASMIDAGTAITSEYLEMESTPDRNIFKFTDDVRIESENFNAVCDSLEVYANKGGESKGSKGVGEVGVIAKIVAEGNVVINQEEREARAGYAEIFPQEGKVVLEDDPEVTDKDGVVKGYRMILYKGERKAYVEAGPKGERPTVILPALPDLGFKEEKVADNEEELTLENLEREYKRST